MRLLAYSKGWAARTPRGGTRGTTLVEVLVASAIMAILMVGVLQMFSLALMTNFGSAARTDLTYRAQQVVENIRMIQFFAQSGNRGPADSAGVPCCGTGSAFGFFTITPTDSKAIPNDPLAAGYTFWNAAGVVGDLDDPFRISYKVESISTLTPPAGQPVPPWGSAYLLVTVIATPVGAPDNTGTGMSGMSTTPKLYLGSSLTKRVEYVAQIAQ